jgi:lysophospholipase L1-like esterase
MSYYRSLSCGVLIIIFLAIGEVGLNTLRAILKDQPLFGINQAPELLATQNSSHEDNFPFNSQQISRGDYNDLELRLWVSSASHAADHHGVENQFPNLLCDFLENESCHVLNASSPGILMEDNIAFLKRNTLEWHPNYVLLYQAYLDIHQSSQAQADRTPQTTSEIDKSNRIRVAEKFKELLHIDELLRGTILRNYSRNYLGSLFLLATPLLSHLPASEQKLFRGRLIRFINETREAGATPILATFVSAQSEPYDVIDWRYKTWLMRYFENYSPETVNLLIKNYNTLIRQIGKEENVFVIDLDNLWANDDRTGQFDDFVHFSKSGHQQIAKIITNELKGIIK